MFELFSGVTLFGLIDYVTANLLMPVGAILIALFVGWRMSPALLSEELAFGNPMLFKAWLFIIRVVAPLAILAILVNGLR
jgi:NSS family neurotransmitter:Na+ symporter